MGHGGIIKNETTNKIGFTLETLQLAQSTRWRNWKDGFNFERVNGDTLFGNYESQ